MPTTDHKSNLLQSLPLFIGLTKTEMYEIVSRTQFTTRRLAVGEPLASNGEKCSSITFLIKGTMEIVSESADHSYRMHEMIHAPWVIEPDKLFGLRQHFHSSYLAKTKGECLMISKNEMTDMMQRYFVVQLNFLNIVCRSTQLSEGIVWQQRPNDIRGRIVQFIRQHSRYPAGEKTLHIKMRQLAHELHCSRLEVSKALNAMSDEQQIILQRGMITVPTPELL